MSAAKTAGGPAKLTRRLILALIIGALAGLAITLQVRGWGTLASEAGGACGTSDQGVSYGACPRGITPALIISFLLGFPAVPAWPERGVQRERAEFKRRHRSHLLRPGLDDLRPRDGRRSRHRPPALVGPGAEPLHREHSGGLAIAAGQAIVLTDDGIAGVNAQSGAQQWTLAPPTGCVFEQLAASGDSAVALAACDASYYVVSVDPATGKAAWQHHVTEPSASYQFQILSVSPVVISDNLTGPRATSTVRVFGADGAVTSAFSDSGIPLSGGTVALNTGTLRSLGYFTQGILQSSDSGLYSFNGDYLVANLNGDNSSQPPVAAIKAPASQG